MSQAVSCEIKFNFELSNILLTYVDDNYSNNSFLIADDILYVTQHNNNLTFNNSSFLNSVLNSKIDYEIVAVDSEKFVLYAPNVDNFSGFEAYYEADVILDSSSAIYEINVNEFTYDKNLYNTLTVLYDKGQDTINQINDYFIVRQLNQTDKLLFKENIDIQNFNTTYTSNFDYNYGMIYVSQSLINTSIHNIGEVTVRMLNAITAKSDTLCDTSYQSSNNKLKLYVKIGEKYKIFEVSDKIITRVSNLPYGLRISDDKKSIEGRIIVNEVIVITVYFSDNTYLILELEPQLSDFYYF